MISIHWISAAPSPEAEKAFDPLAMRFAVAGAMSSLGEVPPSASACVHPQVLSAWRFHALMAPEASVVMMASDAVSTINRMRSSLAAQIGGALLDALFQGVLRGLALGVPFLHLSQQGAGGGRARGRGRAA